MPRATKDPVQVFKLTEGEFLAHCDGYDGICLACGEWTTGDCEPDAREYKCEACEELAVHGAEEALLMGRIEISDDVP